MKRGSSADSLRHIEEQLWLWGVSLSEGQWAALEAYVSLLSSYEKTNIVGTREPDRLWSEHLLDSLSCLLHPSLEKARSLVDIGSGGGLPGIPLGVATELQRLSLLESTGKKVEFLRYAAGCLGLEGFEAVNGRAEEVGREHGYRGEFDAATVRAVAPLDVIVEYGLPFLKRGGELLAMKGDLKQEERMVGERAAVALGGELREVVKVDFSEKVGHRERRIVVVRKTEETPQRYPRSIGIPRKSPLGAAG